MTLSTASGSMATNDESRVSDAYAKAFDYLDYGRALYKLPSSRELNPNSLGYFDYYGDWVNILNIGDVGQLASSGFTAPLGEAKLLDPEHLVWFEPTHSRSVSGKKTSARAGTDASITGLPVGLSIAYEFTLQDAFGAVLITSPQVERRRSSLKWPLLEAWAAENLPKVLSGPLSADLKRFGFCVIKDTFVTKRVARNAWHGSGTQTYFGSNAQGANVLDAGINLMWYQGNSVGHWEYKEESPESNDGIVVFATGLKFMVSKSFGKTKVSAHGPLRSDDSREKRSTILDVNAEEQVEVTWEPFGNMAEPNAQTSFDNFETPGIDKVEEEYNDDV